ncbi:hypothetical protein MAPG_07027, partial [Magnaporthiopsis poae ATCC 64411]
HASGLLSHAHPFVSPVKRQRLFATKVNRRRRGFTREYIIHTDCCQSQFLSDSVVLFPIRQQINKQTRSGLKEGHTGTQKGANQPARSVSARADAASHGFGSSQAGRVTAKSGDDDAKSQQYQRTTAISRNRRREQQQQYHRRRRRRRRGQRGRREAAPDGGGEEAEPHRFRTKAPSSHPRRLRPPDRTRPGARGPGPLRRHRPEEDGGLYARSAGGAAPAGAGDRGKRRTRGRLCQEATTTICDKHPT